MVEKHIPPRVVTSCSRQRPASQQLIVLQAGASSHLGVTAGTGLWLAVANTAHGAPHGRRKVLVDRVVMMTRDTNWIPAVETSLRVVEALSVHGGPSIRIARAGTGHGAVHWSALRRRIKIFVAEGAERASLSLPPEGGLHPLLALFHLGGT